MPHWLVTVRPEYKQHNTVAQINNIINNLYLGPSIKVRGRFILYSIGLAPLSRSRNITY